MFRKTLLVAVFSAITALLVVDANAAEFAIIVNAANPVSSLPKDQVSKMLLKKITRWENGTPVLPVDQSAGAAVRAAFSQAIHGRSASAMASYWQQQIFAGKEVPPAEKAGDAAVVAFVKANPGAIGYISGAAAPEGVNLLVVR